MIAVGIPKRSINAETHTHGIVVLQYWSLNVGQSSRVFTEVYLGYWPFTSMAENNKYIKYGGLKKLPDILPNLSSMLAPLNELLR